MDKEYSKPKVTIDLDEYNYLKEQIKDIQYNTVTLLKEKVQRGRVNPYDYKADPLERFEVGYVVGDTNEQALMEYLNNVLGIVKLRITMNDGKQVVLEIKEEGER